MRLAPAVLLNALMVRYLLHGGDPPGVSMESLIALRLDARVEAHVAKQTLVDDDVARRLETRAAAANDVHNVRLGAMDETHAAEVALDAGHDADTAEHVYAGVFQEGGSELKLYFDGLAKLVRHDLEEPAPAASSHGAPPPPVAAATRSPPSPSPATAPPPGARVAELVMARDAQPVSDYTGAAEGLYGGWWALFPLRQGFAQGAPLADRDLKRIALFYQRPADARA